LIRNPGHVSSPPPLPADTWYCNDCGALVLNAVSPEKCPVCGACKL
jgi:rubrerythrin